MNIRVIEIKDFVKILRMEREIFNSVLTIEKLQMFFDSEKIFGFVYIEDDDILGYIILRYQYRSIEIIRIGVWKPRRRELIGTRLLKHLENSPLVKNFAEIYCAINELNTGTQLFFKSCGYHCYKIQEKYFGEISAYLFRKEI